MSALVEQCLSQSDKGHLTLDALKEQSLQHQMHNHHQGARELQATYPRLVHQAM